MLRLCVLGLLGLIAAPALPAEQPPKLSVLIVDGMNNHDWPRATKILKESWRAADGSRSMSRPAPQPMHPGSMGPLAAPVRQVRRRPEQLQRRPHGQRRPLAEGGRKGPGGLSFAVVAGS